MSVLYTLPYGRSILPDAMIKYFNLDISISGPDEKFAKIFPQKRLPTYIDVDEKTGDVYTLTETLAIIQYLMGKVGTEEAHALMGGDCLKTRCSVTRWLSIWNTDLAYSCANAVKQIKGMLPYNKKTFEAEKEAVEHIIVNVVEARLKNFTYLAGEDITIADLYAACLATFPFSFLFDKKWVSNHPVFMRWFNTVKVHPMIADVFKNFAILDAPLAPPQKKKEQKPKQEQPKKEAKAEKPAEEAEPAPEKKAKHPLEALGKSSKFVLDEWKRQYSNNDTRPVALPWFFEHYDPSEWSIWRVDYKYNDELTMTFMSNNLVGGFFNRLSGSIKYMFGCLVVYGENNNNGIVGAVLVRGQDFKPAFEVAPDWESYSYTKLDASKEEDKKFIENMWAWDEPVIVDGVAKEIADGKVLK
ncbi:hypothetical protein ACO0R3_003303 [Hanseniaspora guilliermondii]